jgi:hypothetical protein
MPETKNLSKNTHHPMFDPDVGFLQLKAVTHIICIFFTISIVSAVTIICNTDLFLQLDADGFNNAAEKFRVPLAIATLSIPFLALVAATHRSEQTRKQMELTRLQIEKTAHQIQITANQNNFTNYYKHIEEFEKFCDKIKRDNYNLTSPRKLHTQLFTSARSGDYKIDSFILSDFKQHIDQIVEISETFNELKGSEIRGNVAVLFSSRRSQLRFYGIEKTGSLTRAGQNLSEIDAAMDNPRKFVIDLIDHFIYLDEIFKFDESYTTEKILIQLRAMDTTKITEQSFHSSIYKPFSVMSLASMVGNFH